MGKLILQQAVPTDQARKLLETGKTDLLRRFISKKGRPFAAFLKLDGDKVGFEFEERAPKAAGKGAKGTPRSSATSKTKAQPSEA
jgi:DNA topoisomerase-3